MGRVDRVQPFPEPQASAVTPERFRSAVGKFATGITVVTTRLRGADHAMTANAFTSVSLDPVLVLVSVDRTARFHDAVLAAGSWAVSVLDERSREAAVWFATRGRPLERQLARFRHHAGPETGSAILDGSLAALECRTWAVYDGGDHSLVVGQVLALEEPRPGASPLLYFSGSYQGVGGGVPE